MGSSGARCQHSIIRASSFFRHSSFGFRHYPDSARVNCWRIMNDLKFAFRQLLKNPGFTAVAGLTLALCLGANTTSVAGNPLRCPGIPSDDLRRHLGYVEHAGADRLLAALAASGNGRLHTETHRAL